MSLQLTVIVPVFNEVGNLTALAAQLDAHPAFRVLWVDNGSTDGSTEILRSICAQKENHQVLRLWPNRGYGGGLRAGIAACPQGTSHVAWIPADGQTPVADLARVWEHTQENATAVHKGRRTKREDSLSQRLVSWIYSWLCRRILGFAVRDVNGLPKIFPAPLAREAAPLTTSASFAFDAEMLYLAHLRELGILEHPVAFHARRTGQSSWVKRRLATYWQTFGTLVELRLRPNRLSW